jgi:hypothetical protein
VTAEAIRGRGMGGYSEDGASRQPFEANLIDFRHSVVQANKRADADDETLEICAHCMCEVDVDPQPHRPGCPGIGKSRTSTGPVLAGLDLTSSPAPKPPVVAGAPFRDDGLDALERMDSGLPQQPDVDDQEDDEVEPAEEVLEEREPQAREAFEPPLVAARASSAAAAVGSGSRSTATDEAASRSSSTWSREVLWTPETVVAGIVRWVAEHDGELPTSTTWMRKADGYPTTSSVIKVFGTWTAAIKAAGFEPRKRGGQRGVPRPRVKATSEERGEAALPQAQPARSSDAVKDSSSEGAATASSARGHARPVDERGLDDEQPAIRAPKPEATADGSGEPERAPAPDPVEERALAERGSERLGPDNPRSAGARPYINAVRESALELVNAICDLLEAAG